MKAQHEFKTIIEHQEYLRTYFAAMAMQGYLSCREFDKLGEEAIAMCSVVQADALIKVLNEIQP